MRFLVDNQLPIALARFLAARGCDCDHVMDVGLGSASDSVIWPFAHQNELIVISKQFNRPMTRFFSPDHPITGSPDSSCSSDE